MMKKGLIALFLGAGLLFGASEAYAAAEKAVFREVKGKVEYQLEGEDWLPAKVGVSIPQGATISTGFKSSAAIEVMGSVILIKPLTRMLLEELTRSASGTKTGLTLLSGKVKTEVKPSSAAAATVFDVKSPTATASVRGTGFEFDGENLLVLHGNVVFRNNWGMSREVQGGEFSAAGKKTGRVSPPVPVKPAEKPVITAGGGSEEVDALFSGGDDSNISAGGEDEYGLSAVIDTYGDELLLDDDVLSVVDEIKKIKDETLAQQEVVTRYDLVLEIK